MKYLLTLMGMTLLLVGCGGGATNLQTGNFPEASNYKALEDRRDKDNTEPDLGEELVLEEAIDLALQHNPGIKTHEYRTESARAGWREARGKRLPHLSGEATTRTHLHDQRLVPARSPGDPGIWSEDQIGADLVLELPLFTGGELVNRASAARLLSEASLNRLSRTREETVFNVISTFYAILEQRQVIDEQPPVEVKHARGSPDRPIGVPPAGCGSRSEREPWTHTRN